MKLYPESAHTFESSEDLNRYLLGGKAVVTLEAPTGKSHTYVYARPKNYESFPEDVRFVYALHDQSKEFYIGMIEMDRFRLTRNSRFLPDTEIVRGAYYIESMRHHQYFLETSPMKIYHEGTCARCGRQLLDEKSRKIGFGPKCKKKLVEQRGEETDVER
jgi:hypothetical protein